jgi:hypothetical protein
VIAAQTQRRLSLASRVLAALVGGYAFAHAATAFLTLALPFARADRVIAATLLAFVVWCGVAIYAFMAPKVWRVWAVLLIGGALMYGVAVAFSDMAARP